jgi:catechol 2,3-dioxygenase-like lactoylglutathione lyase family enzyme
MTRPFEPLGLDHVVLRVRDQAVSERFYVEMLGCTLDHLNERISLMQLRFGGSSSTFCPASEERAGAWTTSACRSGAPISVGCGMTCGPAA